MSVSVQLWCCLSPDTLSPSSQDWAFEQNQHLIIIIFNLTVVLIHYLGRIITKRLCRRLRPAYAGFAYMVGCGRLAAPYFGMLEGPGRGWGEGPLGLWSWVHPLSPSFLDPYSPTFSKAVRGQECFSSAHCSIVLSDGQQFVLLGVVPKSQLWARFES